MKRLLFEIILAAAVVIGIIPLSSCNDVEENYRPEYYVEYEDERTDETDNAPLPTAAKPAAAAIGQRAETAAVRDNGVPETTSYSEADGGRLTFTVGNIFSQGEYYTVSVVGEKSDDKPLDETTTYVNGELYGDFRLVLLKDGAELDSIAINVPRDDRFLIMDSVLGNLSYGCAVLSNKRDFSTDDYPDIIQLDFYKVNELEIPQYGRYFAIFDGRLAELPVYENGAEAEPCGTHLEPRGEGRAVQHLCVYTPSGKSLMVAKYEYIFNLEERRLDKRKVDFLGWNVDNR